MARLFILLFLQLGHSIAFEYADRLAEEILPAGLDKVFFTMCGSTAVDSALKIALAYHRSKGSVNRCRFIGRERGYHGVGFGGISVGGILANRHQFATSLLPNVDHLVHTHNLEHNAFSKGLPKVSLCITSSNFLFRVGKYSHYHYSGDPTLPTTSKDL